MRPTEPRQASLSRTGGTRPYDVALEADLSELQVSTLAILAVVFVLVGSAVVLWPNWDPEGMSRQDLVGGLLFLLAWASWQLRSRYPLGVWVMVVGSAAVILLLQVWYPTTNAAALLVLPCVFSTAYLGTAAGIRCALASSALFLLAGWGIGGSVPAGQIPITMGAVWGGVGVIWASLRPYRAAAADTWYYYGQARRLLEESRNGKVELNQAYADLGKAYQELGRLNEIVIASQKIADEAREAKEAYVANVSHELRTPLNMIIGFSSMIARAPLTYRRKLPTQLLADIAVIERNALHLLRLVDDVLDLGKADSGAMKLSLARWSLEALVLEAVENVRPLFDAKGLCVDIEVEPQLPQVSCDDTRIRQVILNLLSNAGRAVQKGGVRISVRRSDAELIVTVADTGPGIPDEDLDRIFEPFRQLDSPGHARQSGTGLGLGISKKLVELHGGRMWVQSAAGSGAAFSFSLPLSTVEEPVGSASRWFSPHQVDPFAGRTHTRKADPPPITRRVLFVDPESSLFAAAMESGGKGVQIALVSDLRAAVAELGASPAQMLVLNQAEPDKLSDLEEALSALPFRLPIVLCSAPRPLAAAENLGVHQHLTKPISQDALLEAVESVPPPVETILIADDEPDAVQLFARMLAFSPQDYKVLRAGDGDRALEIIRTCHPDLVLLDMIMPGLNGLQVLSAMRQDPELASIPVITISARDLCGEATKSDRLIVLRSGGFTGRELVSAVYALCEGLTPTWRTDGKGQPQTSHG